jgi:hypothetical protein
MKGGTLQAGAWVVWLYSPRGSGVTWYWVSVSWPANMAVEERKGRVQHSCHTQL